MELEIVYEDNNLVAINKPHGLLVHRTKLANDAIVFALQLLRDQINQRVYPVHRLDRKTSGVLLFAKSKKALINTQQLFIKGKVNKTYVAIVRGYLPEEGEIDYPLTEGNKTQNAITNYKLKQHFEIDLPFGKFSTSRYSLVELTPETGRFHQLRKHLAHIYHPIIGDRPHGCNKQNRIWKSTFDMTTMMLHAQQLDLALPDNKSITINVKQSSEFDRVLSILQARCIH